MNAKDVSTTVYITVIVVGRCTVVSVRGNGRIPIFIITRGIPGIIPHGFIPTRVLVQSLSLVMQPALLAPVALTVIKWR